MNQATILPVVNLSVADQVKVANKARRARVWLTCCKGERTDKGVTKAPTYLIDIIALSTRKFDHVCWHYFNDFIFYDFH